ncbi:MAG: 8-amino-7-oxononanoate synthase [Pelosinus sp.]|nr:8-amino-7-oxononanoate synthase [Pelosinus sp.]
MQIWTDYVDELKKQTLYRQTVSYQVIDATHVQHAGKKYLLLASNDYLNLSQHPKVKKAAIEAITLYGTGAGGARLTTGTHPLFSLLEEKLAQFKGEQAALVFNTGYMANVGVISALAGANDVIFSDELNHASIIDGCRLAKVRVEVYHHADMNHLSMLLKNTPCQGKRIVVTDGVFSMDGDIAPLTSIVEMAEEYRAIVIVDDAHATGVIGPGGKGTAAYFGLQDKVQVQIGTLSKALGAEGGFVAGSQELIDYIRNRARSFIFSTALAPATIAAALAALEEVENCPWLVDKLGENAKYVRENLKCAGVPVLDGITPIIPIMAGRAAEAVQLACELDEAGILATAIRPPTVPKGTSRLRLAVSAGHEQAELKNVVEKIVKALKRLGIKRR